MHRVYCALTVRPQGSKKGDKSQHKQRPFKKTRASNINLSATLEQALKATLAKMAADKWKNENKAAIAEYNKFIKENGCFGDEYRHF